MIIIYNLGGLLVGLLGLVLAVLLAGATQYAGAGLLALGVTWLVLGLMWRRWKTPPGAPRPYPSVFFIPLPFLAVPIIPLAFFVLVGEFKGAGRAGGPVAAPVPEDPRVVLFREDEQTLDRSAVGGEVDLSQYLATALAADPNAGTDAKNFHVFSRTNPASVLVLVKAPNLRSYTESARVQLLNAIASLLSQRDDLKEKKVYIGVKGKLAFGAIRAYPNRVQTGSLLPEAPLYDFYALPAFDAPAHASPAPTSGTGPRTPSPNDANAPTPAPVKEPANN